MNLNTNRIIPCGVENGIFQDNYVNAMAANAPAPYITKSSTGMVLTVLDKQVIVFHKIGFQLSAPSWYGEMI